SESIEPEPPLICPLTTLILTRGRTSQAAKKRNTAIFRILMICLLMAILEHTSSKTRLGNLPKRLLLFVIPEKPACSFPLTPPQAKPLPRRLETMADSKEAVTEGARICATHIPIKNLIPLKVLLAALRNLTARCLIARRGTKQIGETSMQ